MSKYCNECETTRPDAKYCPECGTELETPPSHEEAEAKTPKETGSCEKCDSQISVEADRCPECGHEAGPGIIGGILMWVLGIVGAFSGTIALISIVLLFGEASLTTAIFGFVFFGAIAAVCLGFVYFGIKNSMRGPTDPPVFDSS